MVSTRKMLTNKRIDDILDALEQNGKLSIEDIAGLTEQNYYTIRRDISMLVSDGRVEPTHKEGQRVFYSLVGKSVIPSLLGTNHYVALDTVLRLALDQGSAIGFPVGRFERALAYLYAQPLIAGVNGEIKHSELEYFAKTIDEAISALDVTRRILHDLRKRVWTDSASEFEAWAVDPHYDKQLAINALVKFLPEDLIAQSPYFEALKRLEINDVEGQEA